MANARKNLKTSSIIVLLLAGLSLLNILFELFFGALDESLKNVSLPEGSPENILMIAKAVILVVSILLLLPHLYIGFKGLKMAKKPDKSHAHVVWGVILLVITAIGLITPLTALVKGSDVLGNASEFFSIAVDVVVLFEYVKYARAVRRGA